MPYQRREMYCLYDNNEISLLRKINLYELIWCGVRYVAYLDFHKL